MSNKVIIVGAGQAAAEAALTLRQEGYAGSILMIGEEAYLPYQRPPLSKGVLSGKVPQQSVAIRAESTYEKANINVRIHTRVTAIDLEARTVALSTGETLNYSHLIIATGGRARRLDIPGADHARVFSLRTLSDVENLRTHFQPGKRIVIVGAGYVGLEVAAVARQCGLQVTVLETAERILARVTAEPMSAFYQAVHKENDVQIQTGITVEAIIASQADDCVTVHCIDGSSFVADIVLIAVGLEPNTELAQSAGLAVDNGILVNGYCGTGHDRVYAIGDCANHFNVFANRRLRLESVQNALEQARTVAAHICGKDRLFTIIPWFWSDQYDLKLQMVGLAQGYDQTVLRGSFESRSFIHFYLRDGHVIAADAVNRGGDFMQAKRLIAEGGGGLTLAQLVDEHQPLKALVCDQ